MTTRHKGYVVALAGNVREDDAEKIMTALGMIQGVIAVTPIEADLGEEFIVTERVNQLWRTALFQLAANGPNPERQQPA